MSGYLLDTNVLSETRVSRPDRHVLTFFDRSPKNSLYLSVLTLGEMRRGAALQKKKNSVGAARLSAWIDGIEQQYAGQLLGIDAATTHLWGELSAQRTRSVIDTLIAATAITHNLTLVTRNTRDVEDTGVRLLNPWQPRRA